mmetsp:Transcript_46366/g.108869  ORF Transcript_46366/g.108869 Transcript_46366/m.108869 type:complete len:217 (-) Transcript_46366:162-812(-)
MCASNTVFRCEQQCMFTHSARKQVCINFAEAFTLRKAFRLRDSKIGFASSRFRLTSAGLKCLLERSKVLPPVHRKHDSQSLIDPSRANISLLGPKRASICAEPVLDSPPKYGCDIASIVAESSASPRSENKRAHFALACGLNELLQDDVDLCCANCLLLRIASALHAWHRTCNDYDCERVLVLARIEERIFSMFTVPENNYLIADRTPGIGDRVGE